MNLVLKKLHRAREAVYMAAAHAAGLHSSAALLSCYAALLRGTTDATEVSARLRINRRVFPFHFRKCDIFTLTEVLYQRQYQLRSRLPEAPVVIDAGANIGVSGAWFLAHAPGAVLHCFEPQSDNYRLLSLNLGGLDNVRLNRAALGSKSGTITLHLAAHGAEHSVVGEGNGAATETVPVLRLGEYLEAHAIRQVDLLKLDVEGSELETLVGLGDALGRVRVIVGEVHERLVDQDRFYDFLGRAGFEILYKHYPPQGKDDGVHLFEAIRGSAGA